MALPRARVTARLVPALVAVLLTVAHSAAAEPVRLAAVGSLRAALAEAAEGFARTPGGAVVVQTYAPTGLLRQRIEAGERFDVFASAALAHAEATARARGLAPVIFARNAMCVIARPGLAMSTETLLAHMLDPGVRLGMSTPRADPSGDDALMVFGRAERLQPGAQAALNAKALRLTGGPDTPQAPPGKDLYAWQFERGAADLFLTYCTNAVLARKADPTLQRIDLPAQLQVSADFALALLSDRREALAFFLFILSPEGQAILDRHGFIAPALPTR